MALFTLLRSYQKKKIIDEESTTIGSADFTYDARFPNQAIWDAGAYRYFRPFGIVKDKNGNTKTIYGGFILSVQLKMPATN